MLRELRALENGEPSTAVFQLRCERWSSLELNHGRSILPDSDGLADVLCSLDVDSFSGQLLLTAGSSRSSRLAGAFFGCVGVHTITDEAVGPTSRTPRAPSRPLAWASGPEADGTMVTAQWLPGDTSMFVTATSSGILTAWDAEAFVPCARFAMPTSKAFDIASVAALHMSSAPDGKIELVAVASIQSTDLKLLDLNSGSFTHSLSGHVAGLTDVRWSPTNGHLLATTSNDGTVRMFDVRRAGSAASLCLFDQYKSLQGTAQTLRQHELQQEMQQGQLESQQLGPSLAKKPRKKQSKQSHKQHPPMLGLGMSWEAADDTSSVSRRKRIARQQLIGGRAGSSIRSHQGPVSRVRFTGDGASIVSGGADTRLRVWDTLSGHCLTSSFAGITRSATRLFELSSDATVVLSNIGNGLATHDLSSGKLVMAPRGAHFGTMTAIAVHPFREEAFTASREGEIYSWMPRLLRESAESR
jgi:WD40 repeat protein